MTRRNGFTSARGMPEKTPKDRHGHFAILGRALVWGVVALVATDAVGQAPRRQDPRTRRSRPPAGAWDGVTAGTFLPDAFAVLDGLQRPAFASERRGSAAAPGVTAVEPAARVGFKWSALVSEGTLSDEVKESKSLLDAACAKSTDFKGGGYDQARVAFTSAALAFGVIAAYDQDVRWKKDAATARDLFARAGMNCKVGTDQSFAESKARLEDLAAMLDGNAPKGKPDRDDDFLWSNVAGRPALMNRLEQAEDAIRPAIADRAGFKAKRDDLMRSVEIIAVIGEVIQQRDYEYHDDDTYRGYAAAMRDAALEARAACEKNDFEAAGAAAGKIGKSCNACHGDYRS